MKQVAIIDMGTNTFHLMLATINHEGFTINSPRKSACENWNGWNQSGIHNR